MTDDSLTTFIFRSFISEINVETHQSSSDSVENLKTVFVVENFMNIHPQLSESDNIIRLREGDALRDMTGVAEIDLLVYDVCLSDEMTQF